jgi:hypothetical protein
MSDKLSERMHAIWKQQMPDWTEEEAQEMTYFPEWADEVATLEQRVEEYRGALRRIDGMIGEDRKAIWEAVDAAVMNEIAHKALASQEEESLTREEA